MGEPSQNKNRNRNTTSFNLSNLMDQEEKDVFGLIRACPEDNKTESSQANALTEHLERTSSHLDVTTLFNREGYTALTFAASTSKISACFSIIGFIKKKQKEEGG